MSTSKNRESREWTVLTMLEWTTAHFEKRNIPNPRLSIEWLLAEVLKVKRLDLYLMFDRPLTTGELKELRPLVRRRSDHEPLQYILGRSEFMDCILTVDRRVLIPRQETEQLVELILADTRLKSGEPLTLLDIGTGSGCIPISISRARPEWRCTGIDISEEALQLAEQNARENDARVDFLHLDLFDLPVKSSLTADSYDLIISNPPYIQPDEREQMEPQVSAFEPELALFHENPLRIYETILQFASRSLAPDGALYLECNPRLTSQIVSLAGKLFRSAGSRPDFDRIDRFVTAHQPA